MAGTGYNYNYGNGYQPTSSAINTALPQSNGIVAQMNNSPSPIGISFVQGKMGAAAYPIMSSNTTVYLFDTYDQTKFYIKATDAFGMALPLREYDYKEAIAQVQPIAPVASNNETKENTDIVTKEEFEELKAQLAELLKNSQRQNQPKTRKEHMNNA